MKCLLSGGDGSVMTVLPVLAGTCIVGYAGSGGTCTPCGGSSYQDEQGQTSCKDCPSGATTGKNVATAATDCGGCGNGCRGAAQCLLLLLRTRNVTMRNLEEHPYHTSVCQGAISAAGISRSPSPDVALEPFIVRHVRESGLDRASLSGCPVQVTSLDVGMGHGHMF